MLKKEYTERRNFLMQILSDCGFKVTKPRGSYYIVADFSALHDTDDRTFVRDMMERCKVAAVPLSGFCNTDSPIKSRHLRFAFCKQMETLRAASSRLTEARLLGALASSAV
jgi:aspartate/methionine/tyrosine aminotransferase